MRKLEFGERERLGPRSDEEENDGADTLWSVQEVLRFDPDLLGIGAQRGRRRERSERAQLQPRPGVVRTSRLRPAVPFPTAAANPLPTRRDPSPTPTRNRKGLPLPVSVKPHPFLLVFLFFCRKGTWTAPRS